MGGSMRKIAILGGLAACMAIGACFAVYGTGKTNQDAGTETESAAVGRLWEKAKRSEAVITGEDPSMIPVSRFLAEDRSENDLRLLSIAGQCMKGDGADRVFYVIGRNYVPEGSVLPVIFGRSLEYSCAPEETVSWRGDTYYAVRFAVREMAEGTAGMTGDSAAGEGAALWKDETIPALHHWDTGDVVVRTLDGIGYRFRCIDPNYGEGNTQQSQRMALFLCESVIPANTGSKYVYERLEDGSRGYVYYPGPVVNFGESSEYADSKIRGWLAAQAADADIFPAASVGVETGCMGRTAPGRFGRSAQSDLRFYRLGSQILTDRYFILSVDEALKYREYLWNVDGCDEEETAANAGSFGSGYWLRTPMGDGGEDTGCVYVVDLVNGNIHPQAVRPDMGGEASGEGKTAAEGEADADAEAAAERGADAELAVTSPIGIRPAFVLRQRD